VGGAFGAALLAGAGIGVWGNVEAACAATVRVAETIAPRNARLMEEAYGRYRRIYPALREIRGSVREEQTR
jgi:xylulokinase